MVLFLPEVFQMDATGKVPPLSTSVSPASEPSNQQQASAFTRLVAAAEPPGVHPIALLLESDHQCPADATALPPPYESLVNNRPPSYSRFAEGAGQPMTNPSPQACLSRLQSAYQVDFDELARRIDFLVNISLRDGIKLMTVELLEECREAGNSQLQALACRLGYLYRAVEADTSERADKNRLAFIVTIFLLEQKAKLMEAPSLKPHSALSVRREFFDRLQAQRPNSGSPLIRIDVKKFLAEHTNLRAELEGQESGAVVPAYSELCYNDIPGAVASAYLRESLMVFSQRYGVNFIDFIEAMGNCKRRPDSFVLDPVQKAMTSIGMRTNSGRIPLLASDSFLDRNAKLVITAMNCFQGKVFAEGNPAPGPQSLGEKESLPVQDSSATEQKMAEVINEFVTFFLSICSRSGRNDIGEQVRTHIQEQWPTCLQPEALRLPKKS